MTTEAPSTARSKRSPRYSNRPPRPRPVPAAAPMLAPVRYRPPTWAYAPPGGHPPPSRPPAGPVFFSRAEVPGGGSPQISPRRGAKRPPTAHSRRSEALCPLDGVFEPISAAILRTPGVTLRTITRSTEARSIERAALLSEQLGELLRAFGRLGEAIAAAFGILTGPRADLGDPTGDGPM
jgi:hypothetical protein